MVAGEIGIEIMKGKSVINRLTFQGIVMKATKRNYQQLEGVMKNRLLESKSVTERSQ